MSNEDDQREWNSLSDEEKEVLREAMRARMRDREKPTQALRVTRIVGSIFGSMLPAGLVDLSKLGDGEREREFKEGFEEGRLVRGLGDLLTATRKPKKDETT